MWWKMREAGVGRKMCRVLENMYEKVESAVVTGEGLTEWFKLSRGVKQGGKVSPWLYALFINGVVKMVKEMGGGVEIVGVRGEKIWMGCWLNADDIVLVGGSVEEVQRMVKVVEEYARKWRFKMSAIKSKVMYFGRKLVGDIVMDGKVLEVVKCFRYLGIELEEWNRWKAMAEKVVKKAKETHGWLVGRLASDKWRYSVSLKKRVWEACVRPLLEYGVEVWEPGRSMAEKIERVMGKGGRMILGVGKCTAGVVVKGELGWVSMEARRGVILMRFVGKLERMQEERVIGELYQAGKIGWVKGSRKGSKWWARVERVSKEWGLKEIWESGVVKGMRKNEWEKLVEKRMMRMEKMKWRRELERMDSREGSKVAMYWKLKDKWGMEEYLKGGRSRGSVAWKTKLRSGTCELEVEMGRGVVAREERVCKLCGRGVEDVRHFVWECLALDKVRGWWWLELGKELGKHREGGAAWGMLGKWKEEELNERIVEVLLGGGGGGLVTGGISRVIDEVVRKGLGRMRKVRKKLLEDGMGRRRRG